MNTTNTNTLIAKHNALLVEIELLRREFGISNNKATAFVMSEDYFPGFVSSLLCYEDILVSIPINVPIKHLSI